jgi:hypothetical protein
LILLCFVWLAAAAMLAACGDDDTTAPAGGGGGATPVPSFIDCWVEGLEFTAETTSGLTDENGEFDCPLGEDVTFSVGDIEIGSGVAGPFMNPLEVAYALDIFDYEATNIARFLQTIDDDGDPSNGIKIIAAVRAAAVGKSLVFNQSPGEFEDDPNVQQVITELTTAAGQVRTLVVTGQARAHLTSTLLGLIAGVYRGSFDGMTGEPPYREDVDGDWEITVDRQGNMTGEILLDEPEEDEIDITGTMQPSGSFNCNDLDGMGLWLSGNIVRETEGSRAGYLKVMGNWNDYSPGEGTFDGRKTVDSVLTVCH